MIPRVDEVSEKTSNKILERAGSKRIDSQSKIEFFFSRILLKSTVGVLLEDRTHEITVCCSRRRRERNAAVERRKMMKPCQELKISKSAPIVSMLLGWHGFLLCICISSELKYRHTMFSSMCSVSRKKSLSRFFKNLGRCIFKCLSRVMVNCGEKMPNVVSDVIATHFTLATRGT